jgi:uracil-DNA glycosylase
MELLEMLPAPWRAAVLPYVDHDRLDRLGEFVASEYAEQTVYPPLGDLFAAFRHTPPAATEVVVLGQDPYHGPGQAHGLSFSVPTGARIPPSLRNVFAELAADLGPEEGLVEPGCGDLTRWADQGVLLLNSVLTVRAGKPGSHAERGWEHLTDSAITALDQGGRPVVFALWGAYARRKAVLVTSQLHRVIEAGHPSPMNPRGFRGTRPFSAINKALADAGRPQIRWRLAVE